MTPRFTVRRARPVDDAGLDQEPPHADSAKAVYEAVRREGEYEMARPWSSLWWSGVAAGICMSASVMAPAFLRLGGASDAVADIGYCVGFLIVVLGRLQLFTENTITTVLPVLARPRLSLLWQSARLWVVVFWANVVGALCASAVLVHGGGLEAQQLEALVEVSRHGIDGTMVQVFLRAVPAGFFIAALVWVARGTPESRFWVIAGITYLIALGNFAHVVAGSVESFIVVMHDGVSSIGQALRFIVPAFFGNVLGGTGLFALITYAQVRDELPESGGADPG